MGEGTLLARLGPVLPRIFLNDAYFTKERSKMKKVCKHWLAIKLACVSSPSREIRPRQSMLTRTLDMRADCADKKVKASIWRAQVELTFTKHHFITRLLVIEKYVYDIF